MNSLKAGVVVVAVLFSFTCLLSSVAVANYTVAGTEEITGNENQNKETEDQTGVQKNRCGKKEKTVLPGNFEKRRVALQASFRKRKIGDGK